jgi:C1A family cysteine protease
MFSLISLLLVIATTCTATSSSTATFDATFKTLPTTPLEHELAFEHLATLHGRTYGSEEERGKKLSVFKTNVAQIRALREKSDGRAEFAPNMFFDLSKEEFAAFRMKKRSLVEEAKKIAAAPQVVPACLASGVEKKKKRSANKALPVGAPKNFDWRSVQGVVTPVKNQAACGS